MAWKDNEKSVSSCSNENPAPPISQMRYQSRPTDELVADVDVRADDNLEDDGGNC